MLAQLPRGELSREALVQRTLERLHRADARLNAVTAWRDEAALAEARAADAAPDERPLLGLPVTVKDVLDVAGLPTSGGSLARAGHVARADATVVARLRRAGAIVVAKTNVPEVSSSFETDNVAFGRTEHPLVAGRTPGGSSGGEAALLGADASVAGIGTDGGGSIRAPSHFAGTVGLRPTTGRVPETGLWPPTRATGLGDLTCVGPMARRVEDLALLLPLLAGADGTDPYAVDVALGDPAAVDAAGLRVAVYDAHPDVPRTTPGTRAAVAVAAAALEAAGCRVERIAPPDGCATELFFALAGADGGAHLRRAIAPAGGRHHPQLLALLGDAPVAPPSAEAFFAAQARLFAYRARVRGLFAAHDVLLSPVVAGPAPPHGTPPAGLDQADYLAYRAFEFCHVNAVAGLPAVAVPAGVEDGLPVGVQLAAAPWREDVALAAATVVETATGGFALNRRLAAAAT